MGTNQSVSILRRVEIIENKECEFNQMRLQLSQTVEEVKGHTDQIEHLIVSSNNLDLLGKEQIRIRRMLKDLDDRITELENVEDDKARKTKRAKVEQQKIDEIKMRVKVEEKERQKYRTNRPHH